MSDDQRNGGLLSRRSLLRGAAGAGVAATAAVLFPGCGSDSKSGVAAEGPPETTTVRMNRNPLSCFAAATLAADFMKQEGLTDIQWASLNLPDQFPAVASGAIDVHMYPAYLAASRIDAGDNIVLLGGIHVGCWQVFGSPQINSLSDFRGKKIATGGPTTPDTVLLAATLASVGLDVRRDVELVNSSFMEGVRRLASGEVDGAWALPPFSTQIRKQNIGHVVVDSVVDRPWSQYYCCMVGVNRTFMTANPIATKRIMRSFMKAADVIAMDPDRGAQTMVNLGMAEQKDYQELVADLRMMPFNVWRRYDPVDTLNYYSLRLRDAGLVNGTPEQVISRGTDFRYLQELRQELKTP